MSTATTAVDLAIKSQLTKRRKRSSKNADDPAAKKQKTGKAKKTRLEQLKETTPEDIKAIQTKLAVVLLYNAFTKNSFLYSGLTQRASHYYQFPVVTAKPKNKGELPGDKFFLGCDDVAHIEYALRTVYYERYGGDPGTLDHEKWAIYRFNQLYYGVKQFSPRLSESTMSDILSKYRSYGGSVIPPYPNIAESVNHKTVRPWIVSLKQYFEEHPDRLPPMPEGSTKPVFLPLDNLLLINKSMKEHKENELLLGLSEEDAKKVRDVASDDDEEDDASTNDSDSD
jgi:hypothetical protein